jgi:hypothetical protein
MEKYGKKLTLPEGQFKAPSFNAMKTLLRMPISILSAL